MTENKAMQEEGRGCTVHDEREGLHDVSAFSCSMAVGKEERGKGDVRFPLRKASLG